METRPVYGLPQPSPTIRDECLRAFANGWCPPQPDELKAVQNMAGLQSGSAVAQFCGVNSRSYRKWLGGVEPIPYAVWALLCHKAGLGMIWELTGEQTHISTSSSGEVVSG